jgi:hypothetical protein
MNYYDNKQNLLNASPVAIMNDGQVHKLQNYARELLAETERLRRTLAIYADENHYATSIGGMRITATAMIDKGAVAREVLGGEVSTDVQDDR